jgi:hypothetical protein
MGLDKIAFPFLIFVLKLEFLLFYMHSKFSNEKDTFVKILQKRYKTLIFSSYSENLLKSFNTGIYQNFLKLSKLA